MKDEFYIGYLDEYPARTARWVRRAAVLAVVLAAAAALAAAVFQRPAEPGVFEFGQPRLFEGVLYELPFPVLHTKGAGGVETNYVLSGEGKFAAPAWFRGRHGHRVRFMGTLIQKGAAAMIEAAEKGTREDDGVETVDALALKVRGPITLTGELVDTKCYFGVMRPGEGKVHRGCAVRCLSGGVPPGLLVRDKEGQGTVLLLAGEESWEPLVFDPQWAARTLTVQGQLEVSGNLALVRVRHMDLADK